MAARNSAKVNPEEPVLGGPVAEGPTPTVDVATDAGSAPDTANLTEDGPDKPSDKPVKLKTPWGSSVTVSSAIADAFTDAGYKVQK